ncbi:MAG: hypothetical protein WDM78_22200 [Puia sp.]
MNKPMSLGKLQGLGPEEKQMIRKQSVQDIAKLNIRWLDEMTKPMSLGNYRVSGRRKNK